MTHAEQILENLGVDLSTLETENFNLDEVILGVSERQKNSLLENEDFIKSIPETKLSHLIEPISARTKTEQFGIASKATREALGLSESDIANIPQEKKVNLNQYTKALIGLFKEKTGGTNADAVKLLEDKAKIESDFENFKELTKTEIAELTNNLTSKFNSEKVDFIATTKIAMLQENIPVSVDLIAPSLLAEIKNVVDFKVVGTNIEIRKKGTDFQIENPNEKGKFHTFESFIKSILVEKKSWIEKTPTTPQTTTVVVTPSNNTKGNEFSEIHKQLLEAEK